MDQSSQGVPHECYLWPPRRAMCRRRHGFWDPLPARPASSMHVPPFNLSSNHLSASPRLRRLQWSCRQDPVDRRPPISDSSSVVEAPDAPKGRVTPRGVLVYRSRCCRLRAREQGPHRPEQLVQHGLLAARSLKWSSVLMASARRTYCWSILLAASSRASACATSCSLVLSTNDLS